MLILAFTVLLQTAVPSDVAQLTRRAEAGDAKAEYALGFDYARGRGVPRGRCGGAEVVFESGDRRKE
jgi:hypothetical protein